VLLTGDSSGDFLFAALHRAGFANQPASVARDDGLNLIDVYVGAAVRCAPPDNKPLPSEFSNCRPYLQREFELLPNVRVLIGLGKIGFNAALDVLQAHGVELPRPRPKFGHNVCYHLGLYFVIGTYHPSRQNTNTGRLTRAMFDSVFKRAQKEITLISDNSDNNMFRAVQPPS
jgi:uracil-DNA glycosylase family 4